MKVDGRTEPAFVVAHAHEDLVVHGLLVAQPHDRLREEREPVVVERVAQALRPVYALVRAAQVVGSLVEQHVAVAAQLLRLVHRDVDVREQARDVVAVERVERDADRGAQVRDDLLLARLEAVMAHGVERALRRVARLLAQRIRQMDGELVAAQPVELAAARAHHVAQHAADADDQLVAGAVAEVVVDVLEVVDVDEEQRAHAAVAHRLLDAALAGCAGSADR